MTIMNRRAMLTSSAAMVVAAKTLQSSAAKAATYTPDDLKTVLTPLGAERAGNADGSIPAWTGGYSTLPAGYQPGDPRPIPFADEKPLVSITAANASQYADKLSGGVLELFKRNADYRVDVYPTHRTAIAPQYVYDNTFKNASSAQLSADGNSITNAYGGTPFPLPSNGHQVVWNHLLVWKGTTVHAPVSNYVITADQNVVLASDVDVWYQYPYYLPDGEASYSGFFNEFVTHITAPPYQAGLAELARYSTNPTILANESYQYLVGQRRTRASPNLAYDTPNFLASGVGNFDEFEMFNGALNEYDFKLLGKKEMYIPYNCNAAWAATPRQQAGSHFFSPDITRWELHRVWVVEMTLRPGNRNVDARRVLYVEEDTWNAVMVDVYDSSQTLWKFCMGIPAILADVPCLLGSFMQVLYDFHGRDYVIQDSVNSTIRSPYKPISKLPDSFFTPGQLAALSGGE